MEEYADIYKLEDPNSHSGEYFLVENRQQVNYDNLLPATGLAIWHIDEGRLDNYRSAVEMEPVVSSNPVDYSFYLWAGVSEEFTGSSTQNSKWHDGTKSGIGVWAVSESAKTMQAYFDVPGPGVLVQAVPQKVQGAPGSTVKFSVRVVNTGSSTDNFALSVSGLETGWASLSPVSVSLASYQDYRYADLSVTVPKCTQEGSILFSITATSKTDSKIKTTCSAELVVKVPGQTLSADAYETNDAFGTATAVKTGTPQGALYSATAELKSLTLHSSSDVDYFKITYDGDTDSECKIPSGGGSLGPFQPKVVYGSVAIAVKEEYCRAMSLEVYTSGQSLFQKYNTADAVVIECPTATFTDKTLYLAVKNAQKKTVRYGLTVTYQYGYCSLHDPLVDVGEVKKPLLMDPPFLRFFDPVMRIVDFERFARESREYLPAFGEYRSKIDRAAWLYLLGQVSQLGGRFEDAESFYTQSFEGFNGLGNSTLAADVLRSLGELYSAQGRDAEAVGRFNQAVAMHQAQDDGKELAADNVALGRHCLAKGETGKAMTLFRQALQLQDRNADTRGRGVTLLRQSEAFLFLNDAEASVASLILAEACLEGSENQDLRAACGRQEELLRKRVGSDEFLSVKKRLSARAESVRLNAESKFVGQ